MAAVFSFCGKYGPGLSRNPPLPKLFLQRSKTFHGQRINWVRHRSKVNQDPEKEKMRKFIKAVGNKKLIWRPLAFTVMTGAVSFAGCAILQYERIRNRHAGKGASKMSRLLDELLLEELKQWWKTRPDCEKTAAVLVAINIAVFLLWKIPYIPVSNFMWRWFVTSPAKGSTLTLLTNSFSHQHLWHLALNMIVLWSLAPLGHDILGREQFLAFYLTGGVFSSFLSNAFSVLTVQHLFRNSLGASGALLSVFSLISILHPDVKFVILFFPFFPIPGRVLLLSAIGLDLAGVTFRWTLFDHAAHLGGTMFGAFYVKYGHKIWEKRRWLQTRWHNLRNGSRKP